MARISGVDLPGRKHIVISLRYLVGIGPKLARDICTAAEIPENKVTDSLALNASVFVGKAERAVGMFDMITGRAVARLSKFLELSAHLSTRNTVWARPKGRGAVAELAEARRTWQGAFHVERSVTDADSLIVVATGVKPK